MEIFEIHITGDNQINQELTSLGIKNIIINLLTPDHKLLRTEFMSSFIYKCENLDVCKKYVDDLVSKLNCKVIRRKIESPFYEHYLDVSLYLESHFKPFNELYPISENSMSKKLLGTDRVYNKNMYSEFLQKWKDEDTEMCLFDDYIEEDSDWFKLYLI